MDTIATITIDQLQRDQYAWARKNFGPCRARWPLLGVFEETGELAHSQLKQEQGIRGTFEEHEAKKKDAIADTTIYLFEYASCMEWPIVSLLVEEETTLQQIQENVAEASPDWDCLGKLMLLVHDKGLDGRGVFLEEDVVQVLLNLALYCRQNNWSWQEILETTWLRVSKRDWTQNKKDGGDTIDQDDAKLMGYRTFLQSEKGKEAWRRHAANEIAAWNKDPDYVPVFPVGFTPVLLSPISGSALDAALTLVEMYYKGLNGIVYPTDQEPLQARALRALEAGRDLQKKLDPMHAGGLDGKEFFLLRSDDPNAPAALYRYSEMLRDAGDVVRAEEVWAQGDRWCGRGTKVSKAPETSTVLALVAENVREVCKGYVGVPRPVAGVIYPSICLLCMPGGNMNCGHTMQDIKKTLLPHLTEEHQETRSVSFLRSAGQEQPIGVFVDGKYSDLPVPEAAETYEVQEFTCPQCGSHGFGSAEAEDKTLVRHCHGDRACLPTPFCWPATDDDKYMKGTGKFKPRRGTAQVVFAAPDAPRPWLVEQGVAQVGDHMAEGFLEAAKRAEARGYSYASPPKKEEDKKP